MDKIPAKLEAVIKEHVGLQPRRYVYHEGCDQPHLVTFPTEGRSYAGHPVSFYVGAADLRILLDLHKLGRIQSNEPGEITLYFGEP
jgi:hypothetical protein